MTEGKFTEFMKERIISNGKVIILVIIAWLGGFFWRAIYM